MADDKKVVEPAEEKVEEVKAEEPKEEKEPEKVEEPKEEVPAEEPEKVEEVVEEPKEEPEAPKEEKVVVEPVADVKKIEGRAIVSTTLEGDYVIVVDDEATTYKLPQSEFNALK